MSSSTPRAVRSAMALLLALVASVIALTVGPSALASDKVPYNDPTASGSVTLCNRDLNPVTQGSINDLPFIWRAVGSQAAPAPYNDANRAATLYYFQPRQGVPPGDWIGSKMNGTATYTSPDHPISQSTVLDHPLRDFLQNYPPTWNGFVQIRLIYSTLGQAPSPTYAAVNLQVKGDTWYAVDAGNAPCDAGNAISSEVGSVPNFKKSARAIEQKIARQEQKQSASASPSPSASASHSTPSPQPTSAAVTPATSDASSSASSGSKAPLLVGGLIAIAVLVAATFFWRSRRSTPR